MKILRLVDKKGAQIPGKSPANAQVWDEAARWVDLLSHGRSAQDLSDFDSWRAISPAHAKAYDQLLQTAQDQALNDALKSYERSEVRPRPRAQLIYWGMGTAALAYGIGALVFFAPALEVMLTPKTQVATRAGEMRTLDLADGSQITLNGATRLEYALTAHRRHVRLDQGEAYFRVQHDEARPFAVVLRAGEVHDLGTEFDISYLSPGTADAEVKVYHGKVRLKAQNLYGDLKPGEGAQVIGGAIGSRQRFDTGGADWRQGWIEPQDWPLERVTEALSRHSGQKIVFANAALKQKRITGRLKLTAPKAQLQTLAQIHGFRVQARGDALIIG
jgi:transmembrane sensor